ncbi:MAG: helical backbone metal receptor [Burkholderiaceae bacterium]
MQQDCQLLTRRGALRLGSAGALATALPALSQQQKLPRLITIGGGITEVVYALGAEGQLLATDTTSLYPPAALKTPKVGYMRQLSAEGVLSLRPDAVITTHEAGPPVVLDQLRSAGVKVEIVQADHTWNEVRAKVQAVGRASAQDARAKEFLAKLDADWDSALRQVARSAKKPRVLFIMSHSASPQVAGRKTAADAMIRYAGGVNALDQFDGYRQMTAEAMAQAAPDFILTSTQSIEAHGGPEKFWGRAELALTPAFRRKALVSMDALELIGFGPRLPQTVRTLHERITAV